MIWCNVKKDRTQKVMPFGTFDVILFGQKGLWDSRYYMRSNSDMEEGMNKDLSIAFSKSNMPTVENVDDDKLFLFVSTKGTFDGDYRSGSFRVNREHENSFNLLLSKEGGTGEDNSPVWVDYLIEVKRDQLPVYFAIEYAGSESDDVYRVDENGVMFCGSTKDHELSLYIDSTKMLIPGYWINEDYLDQSWVRLEHRGGI